MKILKMTFTVMVMFLTGVSVQPLMAYAGSVKGVCGSAAGSSFNTTPTTNLCSSGVASSVSHPSDARWAWSCSSTVGSPAAQCLAVLTPLNIVDTSGKVTISNTLSPVIDITGNGKTIVRWVIPDPSWTKTTKNGPTTIVTDVHATGDVLTLNNVAQVVFADGKIIQISAGNPPVNPPANPVSPINPVNPPTSPPVELPVPTGVSGIGVSAAQINLTWAIFSNNGVTGYKIFRNGAPVGTSTTASYSDTGLLPLTTYTYTVSSYNASGIYSAQSSAASATTLPLPTVTITANAGSNGSISPSGAVSVNYGANQTFTVTPSAGYTSSLTVDGAQATLSNGQYTFTNVLANHTISASFTLQTETITASAGSNGSISPSGAVSVNYGANQTFTVTPNANYTPTLTVDGAQVTLTNNTYAFTDVTANHTVAASFTLIPPVNGACAVPPNGLAYPTQPTGNLCTAGTASGVSNGNPWAWAWTCSGSNGGTTAQCGSANSGSAYLVTDQTGSVTIQNPPSKNIFINGNGATVINWMDVDEPSWTYYSQGVPSLKQNPDGSWFIKDWHATGESLTIYQGGEIVFKDGETIQLAPVMGQCGSSNGQALPQTPTSGLCSTGNATAVTGNGTPSWNWSCTGLGGGTNAQCSAFLTTQLTNGSCGTANGVLLSSPPPQPPQYTLCTSGNSTALSGSNPWSWYCDGLNGGTNASCSTASPAIPNPPEAPPQGDFIVVANETAAPISNYIFQFGRAFVDGEISNYPQVTILGAPQITQADVKSRWADGSVKFAVISVIIPVLSNTGSVVLGFQNQIGTGSCPALTINQMLGANFNFDAQIQMSQGAAPVSASARQMLQNGSFKYWTSGTTDSTCTGNTTVATTILLADDSAARQYDMGFDQYNSLRPRFYVTFWPATNQVKVRYILEDSNTIALEDVTAGATLTLGNTMPTTVYTNPGLTTYAGTRWTKTYWLNGAAPSQQVDINYNMPYLSQTMFFPNFDSTIQYPETKLENQWNYWQAAPQDLYGAGLWTKYMPETGLRSDIGPEPDWMMYWLATGDWRMAVEAIGMADLAAAWPANFREGNSAKFFDQAQQVPAIGRPVTMYAHPTLWLVPDSPTLANDNANTNATNPLDAIAVNGVRFKTSGNSPYYDAFVFDNAHQPDPSHIPYVLTGDFFYLEQLQLWAASEAVSYAVCKGTMGSNCMGRSSNPPVEAIDDQTRAEAWVVRTFARAAFLSPDTTPEKAYFNQIVTDTLAVWAGERHIQDAVLQQDTAAYAYGQTTPDTFSPLHFWADVLSYRDPGIYLNSPNDYDMSPWQDYYQMIVLGHLQEMGFPSGSELNWLGFELIEQVNEIPNGYDIHLIGSYRMPTRTSVSAPFFTSFVEVMNEYVPPTAPPDPPSIPQTVDSYFPGGVYDGGSEYFWIATGAASFLTNYTGGEAAYQWLLNNIYHVGNPITQSQPGYNITQR